MYKSAMGFGKTARWALCFVFSLSLSQTALADRYRFTVYSQDRTALSAIRNCLDYSVCAKTQTVVHFGENRSHTFIELPNDIHAVSVAAECIPHSGLIILDVNNDTRGNNLTFWMGANPFGKAFYIPTPKIPQVLDLPTLSKPKQELLYQELERLIRAKKHKDALNKIVQTFSWDTSGYQLKPDPELKGYAITDHDTRQIRFGVDFFDEPCDLIRAVRHELEHAVQWGAAVACRKAGRASALEDHVERERMAHLNDIRNVGRYCPKAKTARTLADHSWNRVLNHYFYH